MPDDYWRRYAKDVLNPGFSTSAWWVRFTLVNSANHPLRRVLEVGWPLLDFLDVHLLDNESVIHSDFTGDQRPFDHRPMPSLFPWNCRRGKPVGSSCAWPWPTGSTIAFP